MIPTNSAARSRADSIARVFELAALKRFAPVCPRVKVQLISSYTNRLKRQIERGQCNLILTTEEGNHRGLKC